MNENHIVYICFYLFFLLLAFVDVGRIRLTVKEWKFFLGISILALSLFAGCRWFDVQIGGTIFDYASYEYVFDNPLSLKTFRSEFQGSDTYIHTMDPGYVFFSSLFANIWSDANVYFLFFSCLTVYFLVNGFRRNRIDGCIFLILFIYVTRLYVQYNFIMMRQALALALVWWAIPYILRKQSWKFYLWCGIAALFHFSALVACIMPLFNRIIVSNSVAILLMIVSLVIALSGFNFLEVILNLLDLKYISYLTDIERGGNILNYVECLPFVCIALFYKKEFVKGTEGNMYFNMLIFYVFILGFALIASVAMRITSYFIYPFFFFVNWMNVYKKKTVKGWALNYMWVLYFMVYGIRLLGNYSTTSLYPYKMFFFNSCDVL